MIIAEKLLFNDSQFTFTLYFLTEHYNWYAYHGSNNKKSTTTRNNIVLLISSSEAVIPGMVDKWYGVLVLFKSFKNKKKIE